MGRLRGGILLLLMALPCQGEQASSTAVPRATFRVTPEPASLPSPRSLASEPLDALARLPLVFEPNRGQAPQEVRFLARGEQFVLFLTDRGLTFSTYAHSSAKATNGSSVIAIPNVSVRLGFADGNSRTEIAALGELPGRSHYYLGRERNLWLANVPHYSRVRYSQLYAGIDLVVHATQRQLEFDLIIAPGVSTAAIQFEIDGAKRISLTPEGELLLWVEGGTVRLARPHVYQERNARQSTVAGRYRLLGGGRVGFEVGPYDRSQALVIDPVLTYATIIGGSGGGSASTPPRGLAVDSSGNTYFTGETFASNFPTVAPAQGSNAGNSDVFVTKLNPTGTAILYSTYLGGSDFDAGEAIDVDTAGAAYVTGRSGSTNFPTTPGAFLTACAGQTSCNTPFVAKFQSNGMLAFSTYMGGSNTVGRGIAVDSSGNAYITGVTASDDLPIVNAFQPNYAGMISTSSSNAFVMKLNSTGSGLVYSTYLGGAGPGGGSAENRGNDIAVDSQGSAYVAGFTESADFPVKDPIQLDAGTAFLSKFSPAGTTLVYSTHLGGSGGDEAAAVAVDSSGNAYVVGTTGSGDFPLLMDAFRTACIPAGVNCESAFALKVNATGSALTYSTLLGTGRAEDVSVDVGGNAYITGNSGSHSFPLASPIQAGLQQASSTGNSDAFVTKLDSAGNPVFSTYLGGGGTAEVGTGIGVDSSGNIYVAGAVSGSDLVTTDFPVVAPIQPDLACCGFESPFVARISTGSGPNVSLSPRKAPLLVLRNPSASTLTISGITTSPNFTLHGDCGASLAAGASCTISLEGNGSGSVTINSNASGSPHTFSIATPAFLLGPHLAFSVNGTFGAQLVGTTSPPQTILLRSVGKDPATINNILLFGDYQQTNNCPGSLAPGASCEVSVTLAPTAPGSSGSIAIVHDPASTRDDFFLGGLGSANAMASSASAVHFGTQFVGDPPLPRIVTLTNVGSQSLSLGAISVTGEFSRTHNCPAMLGAGQSCRVAVSFAPSGGGSRTGTLTAAHGGPGGAAEVDLFGTGKIRSQLEVDPLELDFLWNVLNFPSNPQTLTLTNLGAAALSITSFAPPPDFSQTNDCPVNLAPAASCTATVIFTPTQVGDRSGNLLIHHTGTGTPQVILLKGEGRTQLDITPASIDFGTLPVGGVSEWHFISIGNGTVNQPVTLNSITISGEFAIAQNPCPSELPPFFGCALQITFNPASAGPKTGNVMIDASDLPTPHLVPLSGVGVDSAFPTFSPPSLVFGNQTVGTTSAPQNLALTNTGNMALNIVSITTTGPFARTHNCPGTLQPAQSCSISVTFTPNSSALNVGSLVLQSNAAGSPHTAMLSGTGLGGSVFVSPVGLDFGNLTVGTTSTQQAVSFTNVGNASLGINGITVSGDFAQTHSCPSTLIPGGVCTIQVTFTPTATELRNGTLSFASTAPGSPTNVPLQGHGLDFQVAVPPGSPNSATVNAGQTATFNLTFAGSTSFANNVNLTCSGAPPMGNCTVAPGSISLVGTTPASATVNVTTRAASGSAGIVVVPPRAGGIPGLGLFAVLLAASWMAIRVVGPKALPLRVRPAGGVAAVLLAALFLMACGGGGGASNNRPPATPGTPPGSYTITVTATPTTGNVHTITLTVVVR